MSLFVILFLKLIFDLAYTKASTNNWYQNYYAKYKTLSTNFNFAIKIILYLEFSNDEVRNLISEMKLTRRYLPRMALLYDLIHVCLSRYVFQCT